MLDDIEKLMNRLRQLQRVALQAKSTGTYPNKYKTQVSDVCRWQNDGNGRGVTPSKFIERAEERASGWSEALDKAMDTFLDTGDRGALQRAVDQIAKDISDTCDRVQTGQLRQSFRGEVTDAD